MENALLLFAGISSGFCSVLSFLSGARKRIHKAILILWCISSVTVLCATVLMVVLQIQCRFEFQYVYSHINKGMDLIYKISALWSGQEGSFLLWALIMGIMGFFVLGMKENVKYKVFGIYSAIAFCIYIMCFAVQPFNIMAVVSDNGLGLNEALKDPWMVVHPPLVFISYSAMAVLFSLCADTSGKQCDVRIITWLRVSWLFLGLGILSGSIWAYRALGWGGYWAWDPIENAALVPWLILCAFLHYKECSRYPACIAPFSIACFGVFLARSGILKAQSLHSYSDGNAVVTVIISCFIVGTVLFPIIKAIRKRKGEKCIKRTLLSGKKTIFYIITGYASLVFIGTIAPLILEVKTPITYYITISVLFALAYSILLLMWDKEWLKKRSIIMAVISTILVIGIMVLTHSDKFWWLILLWICLMPLCLWLSAGIPMRWKYYLPHLGMLLLIAGAICSSTLSSNAFAVVTPDNNRVIVAGVELSVSELSEKDVIIKCLPTQDIIIQCSQITSLPQGGLLIPYETKPFIILFWIGGFAVIAAPLSLVVLDRFKNNKT